MGEDALRCSLNLSLNVLADSPEHSLLHSSSWHLTMNNSITFSGDLYLCVT